MHCVMESYKSWLTFPSKFTSFRINKLKKYESNLDEIFNTQKHLIGADDIPKYYFLKTDCLIVKQWPPEVTINQGNKEVIVDGSCAASVLRGADVFAPGILGILPYSHVGDLVDIYCDLDGKCKKGLKTPFQGNKMYVGTGTLKLARADLFKPDAQQRGVAVQTILPASKLPVINETAFPKGVALLQNLPSIVCGWVVDAQPYENILDMCAAPGNKTTHMAEMSNNLANIIAIDKATQKVERIKFNCKLQEVTCVQAYAYDSARCCHADSQSINDGPPFPPSSFDKILLDAPCSGLGQRPLLVNKMTTKMVQSYKHVQRKLFTEAVKLLKVGGRLVYSTCTITTHENENLVGWALENFPEIRLVPADPLHGGPGLSTSSLTDAQRSMVQRFGPEEDTIREVDPIYKDSIGFFIAAFTKV